MEDLRGNRQMLEIKNEKVCLCEFQTNDEDFYKYYNWLRDYDTMRYVGRREYFLTISEDLVSDYVNRLNCSDTDAFFKVMHKDDFVGTFKIGHINWETLTADMGIMIGDRDSKGKGLSVDIMRLGMKYAFDKLGMRKLVGGCAEKNFPMRKCFERCGFLQEGQERKALYIEGEYQDHIWYGIFKEEFRNKRV